MSDAAHWQYGGGPVGQPAPLRDGEFVTASKRPSLFGMGWRDDRGTPRAIVVPNPGVGVEWSYSHSGPSWFLLRSVVAQLVTNATVGARAVRLQLKLQSVLCGQFPTAATQAAGLTVVYEGFSGAIASGDATTTQVPLPADLIIMDGMSIGSNTVNFQAGGVGDTWSAIAILGEEFTDACIY